MKQKFAWSSEKEEELKNLWNSESLYKLAIYFHTTENNIRQKASELGLPEYKSNRWTKEEEQLLIEYSQKYVTKTIARKLGRSYLAVQKKAIKLGIELHSETDPWKKWMIDYLKDNINKQPIGQISKMLGLSYRRILTKCKELGIEYVKESWTEEEISILRENAQKCHYTELIKVLPNRSVGAIAAKAFELGIETISQYVKLDENNAQFIKDNWGILPAAEIARQLKISIGVLYRYKKELGLPNIGQKKKWTNDIIDKIREDAKIITRVELAKKYKTSPEQISSIARKNNIQLIDSKKVWTNDLDKKLLELIKQEINIKEIAKIFNMPTSSIRQRLRALKVNSEDLNISDYKIWTDNEIEALISLSKEKTITELSQMLNKTERQIMSKGYKLGLLLITDKENIWTAADTKTLIEMSSENEMHVIAQKMDKSESVIMKKAKELGIQLMFMDKKRWTKDEEAKLIDYIKDYTIKEIAILMNCSVNSVHAKLREIGIKAKRSSRFWTEAQISELYELSKIYTIQEIAEKMNKSYESVAAKLYKLGLKAKNTYNKIWAEEEKELLLELLTTYSSFEVSEILNRSEEAVVVQAKKLGYDVRELHRRWTKEEEILLSDLWGSEPVEKIAKKLNRTVSAIYNKSFGLGLGSQIENNYDGLKIQDISDIFFVSRSTILTSWVSLGLKLNFRRRSKYSIYSYVEIKDLYEFLEKNQNIWDSRLLEKNILGKEPEWLKLKREADHKLPADGSIIQLENLTKQQLININRYYLEQNDGKDKEESFQNVKKNR